MGTPIELWKKWEGQLIDGKFPLRERLGGSEHSAVFLTERSGARPPKAAVKLIPADTLHSDEQLSRWAETAKFVHPHLIRLFEWGRCQFDGTRLLYIVMEYAEENLAEVLPLRALSPAEVSEMLRPASEALAALHRAGWVHSRIQPSNVMAINNQLKLSVDGVRKIGERGNVAGEYDAPEVATAGNFPAADMWSLGMTLIAVLTQNEPIGNISEQGVVSIPESIPQSLRGVVQRCLLLDPAQRCTAEDILKQYSTQPFRSEARVSDTLVEPQSPRRKPMRWLAVPIVAAILFFAVWVGRKMNHQPAAPASEPPPTVSSKSSESSDAQSPAPFSEKSSSREQETVAQKGIVHGSVLHQVLPDVSRGALNTIRGHVKVSVQVGVDASGSVSQAKLVSSGPSRYFAARSLAAARQWRFHPPQVDGKAAASNWILRFQFGRTSTQVFPAETKP